MRIRLRGPSGASTVNLPGDATVGTLRSEIAEKTSLSKFDIKYGYPPKPLHLDKESTLLSELEIRLDGEQLTITAQDESNSTRTPAAVNSGSGHASGTGSTEASKEKELNSTPVGSVSFAGITEPRKSVHSGAKEGNTESGLVSLKRKSKEMEVPELPLPSRGATLGKLEGSSSR